MTEDKSVDMPKEKVVETPKGELKIKNDDKKVSFVETPAVDHSVAETVEDPYCDEKNPRIITFQDVCQAAFMIKGGVDVTSCKVSRRKCCKLPIWTRIISTAITFVGNLRNGNLFEERVSSIHWKFQGARCEKRFASFDSR